MLLASQTIQAGRIARRNGATEMDNPHPGGSSIEYEICEDSHGTFLLRKENPHCWWQIGWNIEDKYGEAA